MHISGLVGPLLAFSSLVSAGSLLQPQKRSACAGNTADDRSTWCDYSIDTDYYNEVPDTGVTREYWLSLEESTVSPDGYSRYAMTVNGSIPGPTIIADWGDTVVVHVSNNFAASSGNGTSIHFHGVRQNYTNQNDGVVSITQCPIPPGSSTTYTWRATQYGHSWYHSHFALQAWEGVYGGILINGPATSNYDVDNGVLFIQDWDHQTVDELWLVSEIDGPQTLLTGLINGTNVYGDDGASNQTGSRFTTKFTAGSSYRFRLVNSAADSYFHFSIDNHTMTVIAADFVPIEPYETEILFITMGQRYDVIVQADQADVADNFWMRAIPQTACSGNSNPGNIKGVVYYGDSAGTPNTTAYSDNGGCTDEDSSNLVPYLSKTVDSPDYDEIESVTGQFSPYVRWLINNSTFQVEWDNPTLLQIGENVTSFNASSNVIQIDDADKWVYIVIENGTPVNHPIHLHGHDFYVLAANASTYSSDVSLNLNNPPRRDVASLAAQGYLVIAFQSDNPGAWLAHCHISFHQSEGFALQIIERYDEIAALTDFDALNSTCAAWDSYAISDSVVEPDSGI